MGTPITNYKNPLEIGKEVWEIRRKNGELIDSYRSKSPATRRKKEEEKNYFEKLELIRK